MVVVDLDTGLVRQGAGDAPDVLDDPAAPRDREGQEQGVEDEKVEAFTEVGAGGEEEDRGAAATQPVEDRRVALLPGSALEHGRVEAVAAAELGSEGFEMLGAVGEDEDVASATVGVGDVDADLAGALGVGGDQAEDGLDPGVLGGVGVGEGVVDDEVAAGE